MVGKPVGLWLSDEDDYGWKEWCEDNSFDRRYKYVYEILLTSNAKVLHIKNEAELEAFVGKYGYDFMQEDMGIKASFTMRLIRWEQVAEKYQGVIITPYLWSQRLNPRHQWYYAWDCASGCIWDADAIKSISKTSLGVPQTSS